MRFASSFCKSAGQRGGLPALILDIGQSPPIAGSRKHRLGSATSVVRPPQSPMTAVTLGILCLAPWGLPFFGPALRPIGQIGIGTCRPSTERLASVSQTDRDIGIAGSCRNCASQEPQYNAEYRSWGIP